MAIADALDELASTWRTRRAQLDRADVATVYRELSRLVHTGEWEPGPLLRAATTSDDDPVWEAVDREGTRREAASTTATLRAAVHLRWVIETSGAPAPDDERSEPATPEALELEAEEAIAAVPAQVVVKDHGDALVVLRRAGRDVAPSFQFDDGGAVLRAVAEVNEMLGARDDPWGVASWWLSPNTALHGIPADEVRSGRADEVRAAARALGHQP